MTPDNVKTRISSSFSGNRKARVVIASTKGWLPPGEILFIQAHGGHWPTTYNSPERLEDSKQAYNIILYQRKRCIAWGKTVLNFEFWGNIIWLIWCDYTWIFWQCSGGHCWELRQKFFPVKIKHSEIPRNTACKSTVYFTSQVKWLKSIQPYLQWYWRTRSTGG